MHLPFNEGYLRMLRYAFPNDEIIFYAKQEHIASLTPVLQDVSGLTLSPCQPFLVPHGMSRHNPLAGWIAARRCVNSMKKTITGNHLKMVAILGVDANLMRVLRHRWVEISGTPLQMILHNQLGESMQWRTRNPLFRAYDFISGLQHPLPASIKLSVLELGIAEAISNFAPAMKNSVQTLEHPILSSGWLPEKIRSENETSLKIGFLGHATESKGFFQFLDIAGKSGEDKQFLAIGLASKEALELDLSILARPPSRTSVPRDEYLAALATVDIACIPLSSGYDFVASGSVIDAIGAVKPIFSVWNRSIAGIFDKYGPIGRLFNTPDELSDAILNLTAADIRAHQDEWIDNLKKVRTARLPEELAASYRKAIDN
ncbi:MAG: hypothetical protein PHW13_03370 [Methylococcales bacterium]|nr:hypothetical protein [Methylococcales bacterium]